LNFTRETDIPVTDRQTDRQTGRHTTRLLYALICACVSRHKNSICTWWLLQLCGWKPVYTLWSGLRVICTFVLWQPLEVLDMTIHQGLPTKQ